MFGCSKLVWRQHNYRPIVRWTFHLHISKHGLVLGRRGVTTALLSPHRRLQNKTVETIVLGSDVQLVTPLKPLADDARNSKPAARKRRSKRDETVVDVRAESLPQGLLSQDGLIDEEPPESPTGGYPTVVQQVRNNMRKFEHCVVVTRVGNFYELYFEHAEEYGPLLNLKVGYKKTNSGPVAMSGFPFFQLDRFLKVLVQDLGKHVAISEEIANDPSQKVKSGGLLFDRQVKRVITPGTLIDENFLRPLEHNYLLALNWEERLDSDITPDADQIDAVASPVEVGLSWIDLSSGDFFTQVANIDTLASAIARIAPSEIIIESRSRETKEPAILQLLKQEAHIISYHEANQTFSSPEDWLMVLEETLPTSARESFTLEEKSSANMLLQYVKNKLPGLKLRLQAPIRRQAADYMAIDNNSLRGLEVVQTLRDGLFKGSLLQAVRRTSTESGARLLAQRLTYPSMSLSVINDRLDLVDDLIKNEALLENVTALLRKTSDTLRLVQKFSFGRGDADDLLGLAKTIRLTESIDQLLKSERLSSEDSVARLADRLHLDEPCEVASRIDKAIDEGGLILQQRSEESDAAEAASLARNVLDGEDEPTQLDMGDLRKRLDSRRFNSGAGPERDKDNEEDIWVMRRDANPTLAMLHEKLNQLKEDKTHMASSLREKLNAATLTLKLNPGLGHICHVKGKDSKIDLSVLDNARVVGATKSTRSFYLPAWTRLGTWIEDAKRRIRSEEQNIFQSLRELVIRNLVILRKNAAVLDELDVACSSAKLANEHDLKRPNLNHSCDHIIYGGRHMMVETGLAETGRNFMPNDCLLNDDERIWLITGPNMAGKSTFLRQTALISILAQTGSFVPAEYVEIGLVDQIFSRVGSADNLSQDQSTFMVEMIETSHILRNATHRSLVIMDEVGRGTTPEDGIAVGYAVLYHLHNASKCRSLFATHFHALAEMTSEFTGLACYCTNVVDEEGGSFRYDHKLSRGVNKESHALKVAMLAGMPQPVIEMADKVLKGLKMAKE